MADTFQLCPETAPTAPAHLDPVETPVEPDSRLAPPGAYDRTPELCDTFRHSGWRARRALVYQAMEASYFSHARMNNFATCGTRYWVLRNTHDPTCFKLATAKCHDRLCTPCAVDRQALIRRNVSTRILDQPHRFLTLTIRHGDETLEELINRLVASFRKLRQRQLWKDRVVGGASFLEITYNAQTRQWNPHLHCILEGRYIPRPSLSELWLAITADSQNVHINLIRTRKAAIDYVTKYATKPLPPDVFRDPDALAEAIQTLSRRRLILAFGRWRNWKLLADPDERDWEAFASLHDLKDRAADHDDLAGRILAMIHTADPETGHFYVDLNFPRPEE